MYLLFSCKIRLRYSRERASQSLPKITSSQKVRIKVRIKVTKNVGQRAQGVDNRGGHRAERHGFRATQPTIEARDRGERLRPGLPDRPQRPLKQA